MKMGHLFYLFDEKWLIPERTLFSCVCTHEEAVEILELCSSRPGYDKMRFKLHPVYQSADEVKNSIELYKKAIIERVAKNRAVDELLRS